MAAVVYLGCTSWWADSGGGFGIRLPDSVTGRVFGLGLAAVGIAVRLFSLSARLGV